MMRKVCRQLPQCHHIFTPPDHQPPTVMHHHPSSFSRQTMSANNFVVLRSTRMSVETRKLTLASHHKFHPITSPTIKHVCTISPGYIFCSNLETFLLPCQSLYTFSPI